MIQKSKLGVLSIVAVAMLLMVALVPVIASEDSNAASEGGTIYLQPGDTYTWAPTFNISTDRLTLTVLASSTNTTTGTYVTIKDYSYQGNDYCVILDTSSACGLSKSGEDITGVLKKGNGLCKLTVNVYDLSETDEIVETYTWTIISVSTVTFDHIITYMDGTSTLKEQNEITIHELDTQYAMVNKSMSFNAGADISPSRDITYSVSDVSNGLTVTVSGSAITVSSTTAGTYTFTLTASATNYPSDSTTVTVIVDPVLSYVNSVTIGKLTVKGA